MTTFQYRNGFRLDVCWHQPMGFLVGFIGPMWSFAYGAKRYFGAQQYFCLHFGVFMVGLWRENLP